MADYYTNYLCHHGIKGQKWGVRRYQNFDGTYTDEGNARRLNFKSSIKIERRPRYEFQNEDQSKILNAGSNAANSLANSVGRFKKKDKTDYGGMTNEELQKRITRMNLEQQYSRLTGANINRGQELASNILRTAGDILAVGASAATIYAIMKQARG